MSETNRTPVPRPQPTAAVGLMLAAVLVAAVLIWPLVREDEATAPIGSSPLGAVDRGDAARTGAMAGPGPVAAPRLRWRTVGGAVRHAAPVVAGDLVYVAASDGTVSAHAVGNGEVIWRAEVSGRVSSTPAVAGGLVLLGGDSVTALNAATGGERWRFDPSGRVSGAPVVVDGLAYVGVGAQDDDGRVQGRVYALQAATGDLVWEAAVTGYYLSAPAVAAGLVVVHTNQGGLHAVDAATGARRWERQIGAYEELPGGAAIVDGTVYVIGRDAAANGSDQSVPVLLALDAASGDERWRFASEGASLLRGPSPAVVAGTVYLGGQGELVAIAAATGAELWRAETGGNTGDPVVAGGVIYAGLQPFGRVYGALLALDAATGAELWRLDLLDVLPANPTVAGGVVYAAGYNFDSGDGAVYAIGGPTERELVTSPAATPGR